MTTEMNDAQLIKALREAQGLSAAGLAHRSHLSVRTIFRAESGTKVAMNTLDAIARVLGASSFSEIRDAGRAQVTVGEMKLALGHCGKRSIGPSDDNENRRAVYKASNPRLEVRSASTQVVLPVEQSLVFQGVDLVPQPSRSIRFSRAGQSAPDHSTSLNSIELESFAELRDPFSSAWNPDTPLLVQIFGLVDPQGGVNVQSAAANIIRFKSPAESNWRAAGQFAIPLSDISPGVLADSAAFQFTNDRERDYLFHREVTVSRVRYAAIWVQHVLRSLEQAGSMELRNSVKWTAKIFADGLGVTAAHDFNPLTLRLSAGLVSIVLRRMATRSTETFTRAVPYGDGEGVWRLVIEAEPYPQGTESPGKTESSQLAAGETEISDVKSPIDTCPDLDDYRSDIASYNPEAVLPHATSSISRAAADRVRSAMETACEASSAQELTHACEEYAKASQEFAAGMLAERIRRSFDGCIDSNSGRPLEKASEKIEHARLIRSWLAPFNLGFQDPESGRVYQLGARSTDASGGVYSLRAYGDGAGSPLFSSWEFVKRIVTEPKLVDVTEWVYRRSQNREI